MYRKISHWSSLGLFKILTDIKEDCLQKVAISENFQDPDRDPMSLEDASLSDFLRAMNNASIEFLTAWPESQSPVPIPNVHHLQTVAQGSNVVYRKDTVVDFHFLLIRLLFGYTSTLAILADAYGYHSPHVEEFADDQITRIHRAVVQFIPFAHALYNVVHSKSFYRHIELLNKTDGVRLLLPTFGNVDTYKEFGRKYAVIPRVDKKPARKGRRDDEIEEEFASLGNTGNTITEDGVFRRWISAFVTHFTAKRILEKHAISVPEPVNIDIRLLSMRRPHIPGATWDDMIKAIAGAVEIGKKAPSPHSNVAPLAVEEAIKAFKESVKERLTSPRNAFPGPHPVFQTFQLIGDSVSGRLVN